MVSYVNLDHSYDLPKNVLEPHFNYFWQYFKDVEGFQEISRRLKMLSPTFLEKLRQVYVQDEGKFLHVLNHGDFHFGNLMYRGEIAEAADILMIDFQFLSWTSPASDIYSLLHLVADSTTRTVHREEIISLYFKTFVQTLKKLGYSKTLPSYKDFRLDLEQNSIEEIRQIICAVKFNFMNDIFVSKEEREKDRFARSRLVFEKTEYRDLVRTELERLLQKNIF